MTASPHTFNGMRAPDRARSRRGIGAPSWSWVCRGILAFCLMVAAVPGARANDPVKGEVKVVNEANYTRLVIRLNEPVDAKVRLSGAILVIEFKQPVAVAVDRLNSSAPNIIAASRLDPDGKAIRIALKQKLIVNSIPAAERLFVDLLPDPWSGVLPGLPQNVVDELAARTRAAEALLQKQRMVEKLKTAPPVRVKVAKLPTFMRYVFDLPDEATVLPENADGKLTLHFNQQIKWDLADAKATMPATLQSISADTEFDSVAVTFQFNDTPEIHSFHEDHSFVVDVGRGVEAEKSDAVAVQTMAPPKSAPAIEPPETVAVKDAAAEKTKEPPAGAPLMKDMPPLAGAPVKAAIRTLPDAIAKEVAKDVAKEVANVVAKEVAKDVAKDVVVKDVVVKDVAKETAKPIAAPAKPAAAIQPAAAAKPPTPVMQVSAPSPTEPAPQPDRAVGAIVNSLGDSLTIQFPFGQPTPAAVFRRADTLWLVFDSAATIDLSMLTRNAGPAVRKATFSRGKEGEGIVRIGLARPQLTAVAADGNAWTVTIGDTPATPSTALTILRSGSGKNGAGIVIPFENAQKIHHLDDPEFGDRLLAVTALGPARGLLKAQDFVELHALPSTHGVVVRPIADDLIASLDPGSITIGRPGGLTLSSAASSQRPEQSTPGFRALTFDTQTWGFDREAPYLARQSELIGAAAAAPTPAKLKQARFNLARFYLAREMGAEAKAVLDVAMSDGSGNANDDVTGSVLKAVADIMLDRPEEAHQELANPKIGDKQDAPVWRAIAYARRGLWREAHDAFKPLDFAIRALPVELQRTAMQLHMRSDIEVGDLTSARHIADDFETIGVPDDLQPVIAVLTGRLYESLGRKNDALTRYRAAAASRDRRSAAQGRLREIALLLQTADMPHKEAITALETLTTVWRGDETETEGLRLLAHLYTEDNRYRDAFHVMRTALRAHPDSDQTRRIQDEAAKTFDSLFLAGKGDSLPPIEALGLFYDFRELTPIGRRGDEMIRRLADRLVSVDLLDQAAELLQHQVDHRLRGAARAQVATRLAIVYLMNHQPDRALSALQRTRVADLSNELRDQRLLLEARAISDIGRHQLALEVIADIRGHEAMRLRSDILWAAKNWREAGEQIERMYGDRWRDFKPLTDTERNDILRAAIAYTLGDEPIGLLRLRERYAAKMAEGPDRLAFQVVSTPIGVGGPEFQTVASKVSTTNTLDAFLRDLRARYPDVPVADAAAAKTSAAAAAKPPTGVPPTPDKTTTGSISRCAATPRVVTR